MSGLHNARAGRVVLVEDMPNPILSRPAAGEYKPDFGHYVGLPPEGDLLAFLEGQLGALASLLQGMSDREALAHHPPFRWSIKQVVGHMTDCERIFAYRALRIARNDATPLAAFDQDAYMQSVNFDVWPLGENVDEFAFVRRSTLALFRRLDADAWLREGTVSGHRMTLRAMAFVIAGHAQHHLDILHQRLSA